MKQARRWLGPGLSLIASTVLQLSGITSPAWAWVLGGVGLAWAWWALLTSARAEATVSSLTARWPKTNVSRRVRDHAMGAGLTAIVLGTLWFAFGARNAAPHVDASACLQTRARAFSIELFQFASNRTLLQEQAQTDRSGLDVMGQVENVRRMQDETVRIYREKYAAKAGQLRDEFVARGYKDVGLELLYTQPESLNYLGIREIAERLGKLADIVPCDGQ